MLGLVLAVSLLAGPQAGAQAAPPPPPDITAIALRAARLAVLEDRRQRIEGELVQARVQMQLGENHPQVQALLEQLAVAERELAAAGNEWLEGSLNRLAASREGLERDLARLQSTEGLGPSHPKVVAKQREIDTVDREMQQGAQRLLGNSEASLEDQIKTGQGGLDPYLRLARLLELQGRSSDAERILTEALAWMRARGK